MHRGYANGAKVPVYPHTLAGQYFGGYTPHTVKQQATVFIYICYNQRHLVHVGAYHNNRLAGLWLAHGGYYIAQDVFAKGYALPG